MNTTAVIGLLLTANLLTLTSCAATPTPDPTSVINRLGTVPIPTAQALPPPVAAPGHPQIAAIGTTFAVTLPGTDGVITALGPQIDPPPHDTRLPIEQAHTTITVKTTTTNGSITLHTTDFTVRDDRGTNIHLEPVGPSTIKAEPGRPAQLTLQGTFHTSAAQITWRYHNTVVAIWDFNIEPD
jgi:hypothetical protein